MPARSLSACLIAAGAALAAVLPAHAAERVRPPAPAAARPLQACSEYGPGFVLVPATGACVRLGGRLRADTVARRGATAWGAEGRLALDARVPTDYGPLRAVVSVRGGREAR